MVSFDIGGYPKVEAFVFRCPKGGHLVWVVPNDFTVAQAEVGTGIYGEKVEEVMVYELDG